MSKHGSHGRIFRTKFVAAPQGKALLTEFCFAKLAITIFLRTKFVAAECWQAVGGLGRHFSDLRERIGDLGRHFPELRERIGDLGWHVPKLREGISASLCVHAGLREEISGG
ncbi:MAG: hypothetical protein HDR37_04890 [Treponema sp.]|nr:hypothetical protein [Treponema sp.]